MKFTLIILSLLMVTLCVATPPTLAVNRVLSLDGGGDYIEVSHSDSLDITEAITIEGWVFQRDAETSNSQAWASKYSGDPWAWDIHSDGFFVSRDGREDNMLRFSAPKDEWFHIACVYDGQKQKAYINGNLEAEQDWPGAIASSPSPVQIGNHWSQYWPGMLDEIRIWNVARTGQEIQATMNMTLSSKHGNDGVMVGSAQIASVSLPDSFIPTNAIALDTKIVNPGDQFAINISVCLDVALHHFTFDLKFDPDILELMRAEEGPFLSRDGADATTWTEPQVDYEKGVITNLQCRRDANSGVEGNTGILAIVTFKTQKSGSSTLSVENLRLLSPNGESISAQVRAGWVDIFPHGSIAGVIRDAEDQTPISGARIEVSTRWFRLRRVYSDREGKYVLPSVPAGDLNVRVVRGSAYDTITTKAHVKSGEMQSNFDFEMKPLPLPEIPAPGSDPTPHVREDDEEAAEDL
ncbi:MAG: carboxypeptidase regulatory-like domain-containing protein [Candidatus Poribacteria bacterium]|nr:carboxypeptidase regulatory-like domain-containing protein [Candidatus Poribacteria bacterium]